MGANQTTMICKMSLLACEHAMWTMTVKVRKSIYLWPRFLETEHGSPAGALHIDLIGNRTIWEGWESFQRD